MSEGFMSTVSARKITRAKAKSRREKKWPVSESVIFFLDGRERDKRSSRIKWKRRGANSQLQPPSSRNCTAPCLHGPSSSGSGRRAEAPATSAARGQKPAGADALLYVTRSTDLLFDCTFFPTMVALYFRCDS